MTMKSKIHFAHANGFPAGSYRILLDSLAHRYQVLALEKFAHNPNFPVNAGWSNQVSELVDYLRNQQATPCYLVGHSFGAVVSFMTACQYPQHVKGLILLDPPLISGLTRWLFRSIRRTPLVDKVTPANQTMNRCTAWPKDTDVVSYFKNKKLFKNIQIECIEDYVTSAVKEADNEWKLDFQHHIEAEIFRTFPLNITKFNLLDSIPAVIISGEKSKICTMKSIAPLIKKNKMEHNIVKGGGHMFPLEQPHLVASLINDKIAQWENM